MNVRLRSTGCMTLIAVGLALDLSGARGGIRLVSQREPTVALPAGGNGDSCLPILGELHGWLDKRTTPAASTNKPIDMFDSPDNPDVAWLQDHATRPR